MLEDINDIRYMLEKAWHLATTGRPGPVWIDVPVNYQGSYIETDELKGYDPSKDDSELPPKVGDDTIKIILKKIKNAKRPVIYAGGGIRLSGGYEAFKKVAKLLGVPVVTYWNSIDVIEDADPLYCGRGGNMGDRPGNFAVQNSDLLLTIGTRISIRQVGYDYGTWARAAEVIMVDIDKAEMKKPTIHVDMPVWADAKDFLEAVIRNVKDENAPVFGGDDWRKQCVEWKEKYPVIGDVRGLGGMIGLEFVKDQKSKEPYPEFSAAVISGCAKKGLMIEGAGTYGNVIRFLAPLVMTDEQLEAGLDIYESVIKELLEK